MNEEELRKLRKILINIYKYFESFCDAHDIKFFACAGTAIGAIRHKGFIPWDDDIDVLMTRSEYEKLLTVKNELNNEDYEFLNINSDDYYMSFAKLSHRHSTIIEFEGLETPIGVNIDIFVMDSSDESKDKIYSRKLKYEKACDLFRLSTMKHRKEEYLSIIRKRQFSKLVWNLYKTCVLRPLRPYFKSKVENFLPKGFNPDSKWYVCYIGGNKDREIYYPGFCKETIDVPFENTTIRIPKEYDWYLHHVYGDYMQLPPVEKRQSHHARFYFNLDRRVSPEEIKITIYGK